MRGEKLIVILLLILPLTQAQDYPNYQTAEINLEINTEIDLNPAGTNPKLLEAEAILNLIPIKSDNQEIIDLFLHSEPEAQTEKIENKITYTWSNIEEDKIYYGLEAKIQTKNPILKLKEKIYYPASFQKSLKKYTEEKTNINFNQEIEDLADELFEKETDLYYVVYKTAKYIENNIKYELNPKTEKKVQKSSWVLENKIGVCDELTNLFISILRIKNIPAKFISGLVFSAKNNKFENHGWAEVYFPDTGWLPFDVTYAQYGWVDITHIKLAESEDSGVSSIDYHWKSSDLELDINKLNTKAVIENLGGQITLLKSSIEPAKQKVGFDSYVPVKITIENPTDFYITPIIYLSKAPSQITKNKQTLLLKPRQIKETYFLVQVPKKLNENYIFKSELESKITFSGTANNFIEIASDYPKITKEQAEEIIKELEEKQKKQEFKTIDFDCTTKQSLYYEDEDIEVICITKNRESSTKDIDICLDECQKLTLNQLEEKIAIFKTKAKEKITLTAEDEEYIKFSTINLNIVKPPSIIVKSIEPLTMDYNQEVDLKIEFESIIPAYNVKIYLEKQEILNTPVLQGKRQVAIKTKGKNLINDLKLKMTYTDELNKEYEKAEEYLVTVKNKPWYIYLFGWIL